MCEPNPDTDLDLLQHKLHDWATTAFGVNAKGIIRHLQEEVDELEAAKATVENNPTPSATLAEQREAADIFILLAIYCEERGFYLSDAVREKHAINLTRKWARDEKGVVRHVKE